jgi:glutamate 5-kinase
VTDTQGNFDKGDIIAVVTRAGVVIAHGLSNYSAGDLQRIRGMKTKDVRLTLAGSTYDEVVHRDNLVKKIAPE